jgi:hypothetical protein
MKKVVYLLLAVSLFACEKEEEITDLSIWVSKENKLFTDEIKSLPLEALIQVFDAAGKDLEIKSTSDLIQGYVWDNNSKKSIRASFIAIDNMGSFRVPYGEYYVVVINVSEDNPRYAYSYMTTKIKTPQRILRKVFTLECKSNEFEEWK